MLLPVGTDDFRDVIENKKLDFIDKTLFIKAIFDDDATKVAVITRPRRFGKTLNLSMLHHYLAAEVGGLSTKGLFDHLQISQCSPEYMQHQGQYPVIFVTFKDVKEPNYGAAKESMAKLIADVYFEHRYLLDSPKIDSNQKKNIELILAERASDISIKRALFDLTKYLYLHTGKKAWLLIDEYDTPIQSAYLYEYYDDMTGFMRGLFGSALKSNTNLDRAVITGILRIAKESLFSDLNNVEVYTLLDNEYSQYFGFTESEIEVILEQADLTHKAAEIKQWYNGYKVGETIVYNPWSIASCIKKRGMVKPYWVNTSGNQLIKELLKKSSITFKQQLETIFTQEKSEYEIIDENVVFEYLDSNTTALWSLFLMSGYLTPVSTKQTDKGTACELAIPNKEVGNLYRQIIEQWLANGQGIRWYENFLNALLTGDMVIFEEGLQDVMEQIASCHDLSRRPENFYHGLLLGLIASLHKKGYEVKSNRESGLGRYDILIVPDDKSKLSILMEFKNSKDGKADLKQLAEKAIQQMVSKKYVAELKQRDRENILTVAIAFRGKTFVVSTNKDLSVED